jgi:hypothetical protein
MRQPSSRNSPHLLLRWALVLLAVLLGSTLFSTLLVLRCAPEPESAPPGVGRADSTPSDSGSGVKVEMRRVSFHVDQDIVLEIRYLRGEVVPTKQGDIAVFDDPNSFAIHIGSAEIGVDTVSLSRLLNRYVFGYRGAPIRDIRVSVEKDHVLQRGKLGLVSFTIRADVSVTADGRIRLHPTDVKVLGLSMDGLMRRFGVTLEKTLHVRQDKGLEIDKNDLLLDPSAIVPPPRIAGRLTAVRLEPDRLIQLFGKPDSLAPREYFGGKAPTPHYMYYHGATLRFGRLTMRPTDMLIVDMDPSDPFDFSLERYHEQLVAGSHRTTPEDGLVVVMPDLHRLTAGKGEKGKGKGNPDD